LTHEPQLILQALARGWTLGDAAAYSIPGYSWMGVLIGDPLYRPFKISFEDQWRDRAKLPPERRMYVVTRQMRLLEAGGKHGEAVAVGEAAQAEGFKLAVALTLADLQAAAGDRDGAARTLEPCVAPSLSVEPREAALLAAAARQLAAIGQAVLAVQAWQRLFEMPQIDDGQRLAWLNSAIEAADAAHDQARVAQWRAKLKELSPPPPGKG
jgi:hypothetical protein